MIRKINLNDLEKCSEILCAVYNNEVWQCRWTLDIAKEYLLDFYNANKFVGFVLELKNEVCGAIFCHEKIWWDNNELYIDELFITPNLQGNGKGSELIKAVEEYVKEHKLAGLTLTTNSYSSAPEFYNKRGFCENKYNIFMSKIL